MRKLLMAGFVCMLVSAMGVSAQSSLLLGVQGGIADVVDDEASDFALGFNAGVHGFLYPAPFLGLGLQARYDRTTPEDDTFRERVGAATDAAVDGALHMFEILPSARLSTAAEFSFVNFFAQAGVGLGVFMDRVEVDGVDVQTDNTETGFVMSVGPGIALGSIDFVTFEVFPEYHLALPSGETSDFYTVKGALSLRFPGM